MRSTVSLLGWMLVIGPPAGACGLGLAGNVPLTDTGYRLAVDAKIDGKPVTLIADTGAQMTMINDRTLARDSRTVTTGSMIAGAEMGAELNSRVMFTEGAGNRSRIDTVAEIGNFALGRLHGTVSVVSTSKVFREGTVEYDGLVGANTLGSYDVDIDIPGKSLRFYSVSGHCASPAVALDQPLYAAPMLQGGRLNMVRIEATVNGQRLHALLDTGAPHSLLTASGARMLGISTEAAPGAPHAMIGGVAGGLRPAPVVTLDTVGLGPIAMRHVRVAVDPNESPGQDMVLGLDFFRHVHVWLSNSTQTVVMQYPPSPSPGISPSASVSSP